MFDQANISARVTRMTGTGWLTPDEMRAWINFIDCSTLLSDYLDQQLRRDAGVTHADYSLLGRLSARPDHTLGMSVLAEQLKFTRSRLTRAVIRRENVGYVRRRDDPADRRGQLVELTEEGMELLNGARCSTRSVRNRWSSWRPSPPPSSVLSSRPTRRTPTRRLCPGTAADALRSRPAAGTISLDGGSGGPPAPEVGGQAHGQQERGTMSTQSLAPHRPA